VKGAAGKGTEDNFARYRRTRGYLLNRCTTRYASSDNDCKSCAKVLAPQVCLREGIFVVVDSMSDTKSLISWARAGPSALMRLVAAGPLASYNAASAVRTSTFRHSLVECMCCRIIASPMSASSTSYAERSAAR
jgi:hypothetical protein